MRNVCKSKVKYFLKSLETLEKKLKERKLFTTYPGQPKFLWWLSFPLIHSIHISVAKSSSASSIDATVAVAKLYQVI